MDNPVHLETQASLQKSRRFLLPASVLITSLIIAAVGTYIWINVYNACEVEAVQDASALLTSQLKRYDDLFQATTGVYKNSVVLPVTMLQQIVMYTNDVAVPACMQSAKNELINYMQIVIRAFHAFGAGESDAAVRELIAQSNTHYLNFTTELDAVNKCAPFCFP